jgi:hypothetical protein
MATTTTPATLSDEMRAIEAGILTYNNLSDDDKKTLLIENVGPLIKDKLVDILINEYASTEEVKEKFKTFVDKLLNELSNGDKEKYFTRSKPSAPGKGKPAPTNTKITISINNGNMLNLISTDSNDTTRQLVKKILEATDVNKQCTSILFKELLIILYKNNGQKISITYPPGVTVISTGGAMRKPTRKYKRKRATATKKGKSRRQTKNRRKPTIETENVIHMPNTPL